jgi:hypothetical protein
MIMKHLRFFLPTLASTVLLVACSGGSGSAPIGGLPVAGSGALELQAAQPLSSIARTQAHSTSCLTHRCIYASGGMIGSGSPIPPLLGVFRARKNRNVVRVQTITGDETNLNLPGVAVDARHNIYTVGAGYFGTGGGTVTVYAPGSNGNVPPSRTISGAKTGLDNANGIAVDARGKIYVANSASVTEYAAGSNGNVKSSRTIGGPRTGLASPNGIAIDANNNIYVMNSPYGATPAVTVYAAGAHGNVAPIQTISGSSTGLSDPSGIAVDAAKNIYVTICASGCNSINDSTGAVLVFASGSDGNVAPIRDIEGGATALGGPGSIAVDADANIYVTQYYNNGNGPCQAASGRIYVFVYSAGANGNATPIQHFQSADCPPAGIAVR